MPERAFYPDTSDESSTREVMCAQHRCLPLQRFNASTFETRSLPTLARSYPRHFTFYVAHPIRSVQRFTCHAVVLTKAERITWRQPDQARGQPFSRPNLLAAAASGYDPSSPLILSS